MIDPLTFLLTDKSILLRQLVLTELLRFDEGHHEVRELVAIRDKDPLVGSLLKDQDENGTWKSIGFPNRDPYYNCIHGLNRLAYLGYSRHDQVVQRAAEFLFSLQQDDGSWPLTSYRSPDLSDEVTRMSVIPLQTAIPLAPLVKAGYEKDPRVDKAFSWLETYQLPDSSWPAKVTHDGEYPYQLVGYRRMPNSPFGCRSNTTQVLICYAHLASKQRKQRVQKTLDLLLSRETRERQYIGFEVSRTLGFEQPSGFLTYHGRFDLALILDLVWRLGAAASDVRIAELIEFMHSIRGAYGLWEYTNNPQASRWVSFDLARSLAQIQSDTSWLTTEPRTKYKSYSRMPKRY